MGEAGKAGNEMMHRAQSSFEMPHSLNRQLELTHLNLPLNGAEQLQHFAQGFGDEFGKRNIASPSHNGQIPPLSPYSGVSAPRSSGQMARAQSYVHSPSHSRSLSQPSVFNLDSLPPLSPSSFRDSPSAPLANQLSVDVSMEDKDGSSHLLPPSPYTRINGATRLGESLPPRKAHRRSNSDIPFGFSMVMQSSPPLLPLKSPATLERSASDTENFGKTNPSSSRTAWNKAYNGEGTVDRKSEGEVIDDLFNTYMSLDNIDVTKPAMNAETKANGNHEDLDSRASGSKTNVGENSDNEAESSVHESGNRGKKIGANASEKREGIKRSAGADIAPTTRHYRSISMDSVMGNMHFGEEFQKLPPSPGSLSGGFSPGNSLDTNINTFRLEFGKGEFTSAELKKIMANDKLAEIALADPKRAKRILANRQSAARSKERKMRYISELEHKVQTLQSEATTLSAQVTVLQRESAGLSSQNNELKFRLQAMEQQAQLRDALNEALSAEVQRLKMVTQEISNNAQMFQHRSSPYNLSQPQQNGMNSNHESAH